MDIIKIISKLVAFLTWRTGVYSVSFTIPPAGHTRLFEEELTLTRFTALKYLEAAHAPSIFNTCHVEQKHKDTATELGKRLTREQPQYCWAVGVIIDVVYLGTKPRS